MEKRILLLSDVNSSHTRKLVLGLAAEGFVIGIFSLSKRSGDWFSAAKNIAVFDEAGLPPEVFQGSSAGKLTYLKQVRRLKKTIRAFQPGILHAHYATSYGMIGWLAGFHPYVISAWGSDVLDFPKTALKKSLLRKILASADQLMVTSHTLEKAVKLIDGRDALVTPFGVDTELFKPVNATPVFPAGTVVFGTVKSLENVYGTNTLIRAFALVKKKFPASPAGLLLVGDGTERKNLESLVAELGLTGSVLFQGRVDHAEISQWHNRIDVFMNLSVYESFGVSVLEAMACEKPAVVTDTGGLAEIVEEGINGFRIPVGNAEAAAAAMIRLLENEALRKQLGKAGREKVQRLYTWKKTMELMTAAYENLLAAQ
jgi:glycosyltransferase involved in cell wall biosynthesis